MTKESKPNYKCQFCGKSYAKESTLTAHLCEQKRRHQQQHETGVQFGLRSYLTFYQMTQGSSKTKSYEDFAASPYYQAFVKFGRYCVSIRCLNFANFTEWLLKNNKKLDYWCKDSLYVEWLHPYLQKEAVQDALERALKEMQSYADDHPELKNGFTDYFRYGNGNRICHHITTGRISPWVIYNSSSGIDFLSQLTEDQTAMIWDYIDPEYWQRKFKDYPEDTQWVKDVLKQAGL
jgi:hypothetical protein